MDAMLTETFDHKRGAGDGTLTTIAADQTCTPLDPLGDTPNQDYPVDKLYNARHCATKYTALRNGDYITVDSVDYAVRTVDKVKAQGGLDEWYRLLVEKVT